MEAQDLIFYGGAAGVVLSLLMMSGGVGKIWSWVTSLRKPNTQATIQTPDQFHLLLDQLYKAHTAAWDENRRLQSQLDNIRGVVGPQGDTEADE